MKFKRIIPYLLAGLSLSAHSDDAAAQSFSAPDNTNKLTAKVATSNNTKDWLALAEKVDGHFSYTYNVDKCLDLKAENLCNVYMDNMLSAQKRLAPYVGKRGYQAAVRKELPGAPVGLHCVYGQYTQLQRALGELGDTLTIVPKNASRACAAFKSQMRQKYTSAKGYTGCIFEGKMYESDAKYNEARDAYLARHHATTHASIVRYTQKFEQNNFSVESIEPGSMMIVPRSRGSNSKFHMIMYLGRGRIANGQFVPDTNGRPVFTAHNRERIGYLFDAWDTNNVFAANIQKIVHIMYAQELSRIESMPRQKLIEYVLTDNRTVNAEQLNHMPTHMLQKMARDRYFKGQIPHTIHNDVPYVAQNNAVAPLNVMIQNSMAHTM